MKMDFKELSRVADSLENPTHVSVSVEGLNIDDSPSPLDDLDVREQILDEKRPKYVFIDDAYVEKLMSSPSSSKKKILSRMTDAERRRVFTRHKKLKKIKDSEEGQKRLDIFTLESALTNYLFTRDSYCKEILDRFLALHEGDNEYNCVREFLTKLNDNQDYSKELSDVKDLCSSYNVDESFDAALAASTTTEPEFQEEDLSDDAIESLEETADKTVDSYLSGESDDADLSAFIDSTHSYNNVYTRYKTIFDSKVRSEFTTLKNKIDDLTSRMMRDSAIDDIADGPAYDEDGKEIVDEPETSSVLLQLSEALEAFAEGDSTLLQAIAQTEGDSTPDDTAEPDSNEGDPNPDENTDKSNPDEDEPDSDENEDLTDSVSLAKLILNGGSGINAVIDKLYDRVPALQKYQFKVSDCDGLCREASPSEGTVINVPLTCAEYQSMYAGIPACVPTIASQADKDKNPVVASYSVDGDYLITNPETIPQRWIPICGSIDDVVAQLQESDQLQDKAELSKKRSDIIKSNCVLLDSLLKAASLSNHLDVIDNKFYKKSLADSSWSFDNKPACLAGDDRIKDSGSLTYGKSGEIVVNIYGQDYTYSE